MPLQLDLIDHDDIGAFVPGPGELLDHQLRFEQQDQTPKNTVNLFLDQCLANCLKQQLRNLIITGGVVQ